MNIKALQTFLDSHEIPRIKKKPKTFLGIAKQPHYENVLSNIYAFYFNVNEEHQFKNLFIKSLVACISDSKIANKDFSGLANFKIETEYYTDGLGLTKNKGRIDLLLRNNDQAIIIENKVYHHLNNDLDDYWYSVKLDTDSDKSKIGIILSLKPVSKDTYQQYTSKNHYINITHLQLMKKVMENIGDYLLDANEKHLHFLKDFYQNIINLSSPTMSENNISFYIKNKTKVNQLVSLKYEFKKHIIAEVEKAGHGIDNVKLALSNYRPNNDRLRHYESTNYPELVYTIVFEKLLKDENRLCIIVEPRGEALKEGTAFKNVEFNKDENLIIQDSFYSKINEGWAHFASKGYDLNTNNIADLGAFIQKKIKDDHFASIMEKLENHLLKPTPRPHK